MSDVKDNGLTRRGFVQSAVSGAVPAQIAPDECYVIDSTNAAVRGLDGAASSFVEFLYASA